MAANQILLQHNSSLLSSKLISTENKSMIKGVSRERFKKVNWVSDANLSQVKLFQSEDCPSKVRSTADNHQQMKSSKMLHSSVMGFEEAPPGFGGKGYSDTFKPICIPQVKWNCPPMFMMSSDFSVVAGEESSEKETQKNRELGMLEALYPHASAIPQNPLVSPEVENCDYDDSQTPVIPLIPIEDEDALRDDSTPCSNPGATSEDAVSVKSSQQNLLGLLKANGVDADVVAAASAAFTAVVKTIENGNMVDTDLLIRILSDPELLDLLSTYIDASATTKVTPIELKPVAASTYLPTKGCHTSVCQKSLGEISKLLDAFQQKLIPASDKLLTSQPIQVQTVPVPNMKPHVFTSSLQANGNSNQFSNYLQPVTTSVSESPIQFHSMPSVEPRPILSKLEDVNRPLRATISSSLGSETTGPFTLQAKNNSVKPVNGRSEFTRTVTPSSSSHNFGSNASSLNLFTQPDRYRPQNPVNFDHTKGFSRKPQGLCMNMASSARQEDQILPPETHSMQSSSSVPPFSSISTPVVKDVNYYKSLIRLHGMGRQESQPEYTPQHPSIVSEPTAVSRQADAQARVQKPCRFFNSSNGCRRGSSCPFEHVSSLKRAGNLTDANSIKRFKFSGELAGRM